MVTFIKLDKFLCLQNNTSLALAHVDIVPAAQGKIRLRVKKTLSSGGVIVEHNNLMLP